MTDRRPVDVQRYVRRSRTGPCFVCELIAGNVERVYALSLGSQQGNRHVHWHVAPLPPDVPYEEQQLEALSWDKGVLDLSEAEMATLASQVRQALTRLPGWTEFSTRR